MSYTSDLLFNKRHFYFEVVKLLIIFTYIFVVLSFLEFLPHLSYGMGVNPCVCSQIFYSTFHTAFYATLLALGHRQFQTPPEYVAHVSLTLKREEVFSGQRRVEHHL